MTNPVNENALEETIRRRAYQLWEDEGRPDGRDIEHWEQARRELAEQVGGGAVIHVPADDATVTGRH